MEGNTYKPYQQKYGFSTLEIGETISWPVTTKLEEVNARKAAYNVGARSDKLLSARLIDGRLHVTRIE